jgi:predicted type IV restriction endonuclease
VTDEGLNRRIADLPEPSRKISINEISEYLFDRGVASSSITSVTGQIDELIRIAKWYQRTAIKPSESETIAYLVIPLLRALGWTPQKMAIEWNSVDVALFKTLPRDNVNLSVVVEAKQKDLSCLTAKSQAQNYAEQIGRETCNRLIVTDGIRYGVYFQREGKFRDHPDAYLNITNMREAYPVLHCRGAKDAFLYLSADWKA